MAMTSGFSKAQRGADMAGGDLLGTSVSGLLAFQRGLAVTGHNVTNASTPGYSRQRVELVTRPPTPSGDGYIGNGVQIDTVARVIDGFLTGQMNAATAANSQLQEYYRLASQVDNMLADPAGGLAPSLQRFFNAVNDVADDPTSTPARQVLLSEARSLADRFHYLDTRLEDLSRGVNVQVTNSVNEINELAASIARLNGDIALSQRRRPRSAGRTTCSTSAMNWCAGWPRRWTSPPCRRSDGSLSVFIGTGQTLVMGNTANRLQRR
ncbi:MAG: flagellar basal body protein [Chromatiales bacterium]|nr:flagellar basal body protein [Chromatiales bacterium]